ncbi:putative cyclin-H [Taenia crassiceps]|uniref:Cyclin-H n=1 Tax=Taenia crassiceps TaxID=6207 RepID=A0ABR4QS32_9CEST
MFRNQYDHDVSVWSPQGRIHQIEYAMEAVKQGSAAVALKSRDYCVIVALKRAPSELSSYQEKYMRRECADNRWAYDEPLPVSRLLSKISLKMQVPTQQYGRRPFGVGMLITGFDEKGPHVYYLAFAVGSRSQSARTYLERHLSEFPDSTLEELIVHGLKALKGCLPAETELTGKNCALAVVGKDRDFSIYSQEDIVPLLSRTSDAPSEESQVVAPTQPCEPAYVTSTQLYNWRFTPDELANQRQESNSSTRRRLAAQFRAKAEVKGGDVPSEPTFLTAEEEFVIVKRYIFAMKELFYQFSDSGLPVDVFGFAATYLKRFYLNNSVMDYFPREMMLTALYLACKVADYPLGLETFAAHIPRNREHYSEIVVHSELFLMEKLQYDIWIHTPYRPLNGLLVDLLAYRRIQRGDTIKTEAEELATVDMMVNLKKEGHEIIHKWFQTDLCLTHSPSQFALAVLLELGRKYPDLGVEEFVKNSVCQYNSSDESMEQKWMVLNEKMEQIQSMVGEFEFISDLTCGSDLEAVLMQCRNPLYDPLSEEYAAAKKQAEKLLSFLD